MSKIPLFFFRESLLKKELSNYKQALQFLYANHEELRAKYKYVHRVLSSKPMYVSIFINCVERFAIRFAINLTLRKLPKACGCNKETR